MDLIVYQMMEFEVMHVADGDRVVKQLTGASVSEPDLAVSGDRNALPQFSVRTVVIEELHGLRVHHIFIFCLELIPIGVDVIIREIKSVHNVVLSRAVEVRGSHIKSERFRSQGQVDLQNLSDVHTGRHAQRVQHDIQGTSVGKIRHIFNRKHSGNDTLVSVTACHLIADGDLSLLRDIDADCLVDAGAELVAVLPLEYLGIDNDAVLAVRDLEGSVTDLSGLLAEDRAQQLLLRCQLGLSLRGHLADKDITCADFRADADDSHLIQVFKSFLAYAGDISCDLFRTEFGISCFTVILLDVDRGIYIISYKALAQKNSVLVVVTFPSHEADQRVLAQRKLAVADGRAVSNDLAFSYSLAREDDRLLVVAVALVGALELGEVDLFLRSVVVSHLNGGRVDEFNNTGLGADHADT